MSKSGRWRTIDEVRADASVCCRCDLCYTRTWVVFGQGPAPARIMLVGEGPGAEEDMAGRPFVGKAGYLLNGLLAEAGVSRENIWVTNIVRCRPVAPSPTGGRNRPIRPDEVRACDVWLAQEFRFARPEVVVCLGTLPAQVLISRSFRMKQDQGRWYEGRGGIPAIATYHPSYVPRFRWKEREIVQAQMVRVFKMALARAAESKAA